MSTQNALLAGGAAAALAAYFSWKERTGSRRVRVGSAADLDESSYELWTSAELALWLCTQKALSEAEGTLLVREHVDGACAGMLSDQILKECGITAVGSRMRTLSSIKRLLGSRQRSPQQSPTQSPSAKPRTRGLAPGTVQGTPEPPPRGVTSQAAKAAAATHLSRLQDLTGLLASDQFQALPPADRKNQLSKTIKILSVMIDEQNNMPPELQAQLHPALDRLHKIVLAHDKAIEHDEREEELHRLQAERDVLVQRKQAILQEQRQAPSGGEGGSDSDRCRKLRALKQAISCATPDQLDELVREVTDTIGEEGPQDVQETLLLAEVLEVLRDLKEKQEERFESMLKSEETSQSGPVLLQDMQRAQDQLGDKNWRTASPRAKLGRLERGYALIDQLTPDVLAVAEAEVIDFIRMLKHRQGELTEMAGC